MRGIDRLLVQKVFARLLADIEAAERSCHLEFYIWCEGGEADKVVDALVRASKRVVCRVLVDAMGSRARWSDDQAEQLSDAGVMLLALPGGLLRAPFVRFDLRLHRKIVVIDVGSDRLHRSLNLVDPRYSC